MLYMSSIDTVIRIVYDERWGRPLYSVFRTWYHTARPHDDNAYVFIGAFARMDGALNIAVAELPYWTDGHTAVHVRPDTWGASYRNGGI